MKVIPPRSYSNFLSSEGNLTHPVLKKEINLPAIELKKIEHPLESYHRSNQDTCLVHRPAVFEGEWVHDGIY